MIKMIKIYNNSFGIYVNVVFDTRKLAVKNKPYIWFYSNNLKTRGIFFRNYGDVSGSIKDKHGRYQVLFQWIDNEG